MEIKFESSIDIDADAKVNSAKSFLFISSASFDSF